MEILSHLFALDLGWFINLVMDNLLWVFLFAAAGLFMRGTAIRGGIYLALLICATMDIATLFGWSFMRGAAFVPVMVLISLLFFNSFFENYQWGKNLLKLGIVASLSFYFWFIFINVIL